MGNTTLEFFLDRINLIAIISTKSVEILYIKSGQIMKLSTRGRYGLRFMLELAVHYNEGPIFLKDIAQRQGISEKYLWQLIHPLKTAGLINSTRGAHGGYQLAKNPEDITLKDIMQVVEGPLCLVDCVDNASICERASTCITRNVWQEATRVILKTLESLTLETMVKRQTEKEKQAT